MDKVLTHSGVFNSRTELMSESPKAPVIIVVACAIFGGLVPVKNPTATDIKFLGEETVLQEI